MLNFGSYLIRPLSRSFKTIELKAITPGSQLDAALGCVIGAFIGDSLGSALEFQTNITTLALNLCMQMNGGVFGNGPGQVTDDSELAMCLLRGLCHALPHFSDDCIADYYRKWVHSGPFDIGSTTRTALGPLWHNPPNPAETARKSAFEYNQQSKSNGSFMRSSPLAVFCRRFSVEDITKAVFGDVTLTHSSQTVIQAETYYIICMAHLIEHPKDKAGALAKANLHLENCNSEVKEWVAGYTSPQHIPGVPNIGFARIAFEHTFRQLLKENVDFERAMREVIGLGGDTDTNAAIVGAMVGAYVGYCRLPEEWKAKVEGFNENSKGIRRPMDLLDQTKVKEMVIRLFLEAPESFVYAEPENYAFPLT
jgi:ADP-ribosyl-[dinitrogen reductase] hydrolase